ncbi:uncharacterized protein VNE69_02218 [Vairimorpha necatrix]|uniref:Uncharacterized protein n=1 Tax=Vairimorpha necatrix TaxID=6039 RepID=A0AAX4J9P4_9MICR
MNALNLLSSILFIKENQHVYNNIKDIIFNKIQTRDYLVFDKAKKYTMVSLFLYSAHGTIECTLEDISSTGCAKKNYGSFEINYADKSLEDISKTLEDNIIRKLNFPNNDFTILLYNKNQIRSNSLFKDNGWEIFYDNICENDCPLYEMLIDIQNINIEHVNVPCIPLYPINSKKIGNIYFFRFSIEIENVCNFFEIEIDELLSFVRLNTENIRKVDQEIIKTLFYLYQIADSNFPVATNMLNRFEVTPSKIEIKYPSNFVIEIKPDLISFFIGSIEYLYYLKLDSYQNDGRNYIEKQCFTELQIILQSISEMVYEKNYKCIYFLHNLLIDYEKVDFLILRILNNSKSALNTLFCHILLYIKIIKKHELDLITGREVNSESNIEVFCKQIMKKLSIYLNSLNVSESYLLAICLLLEVEMLINENGAGDDPLFRILLIISNIIESEKNKDQTYTYINKDKIKITNILKEVKSIHIDEIVRFKKEIIKNISKISSLFTGLSSSKFVNGNYPTKIEAYVKKDIITDLKLDEYAVERNTKNLRKKLLENTAEDYKFEKERRKGEDEIIKINKIIEKLPEMEELKKMKTQSIYSFIENLFDADMIDNLDNNFKNVGITKIDKIFNGITNTESLDINIILEYKKKFIESFFQDIKINIEDRIKKISVKELFIVFIKSFENEISTENIDNKRTEKIFKNIRTVLKEETIIKVLYANSAIELHDELMHIIKKYTLK